MGSHFTHWKLTNLRDPIPGKTCPLITPATSPNLPVSSWVPHEPVGNWWPVDPNALLGYPLVIKHGNFLNTTHLWISSPFQPPEKILQITKSYEANVGSNTQRLQIHACVLVYHTHIEYIYIECRNQFKRTYKDKHFHNRCIINDNDVFHIFYNIMIEHFHHFSGSISPLRFCTAKIFGCQVPRNDSSKDGMTGHNGTWIIPIGFKGKSTGNHGFYHQI